MGESWTDFWGISYFWAKFGMVGKKYIPDRLGFSRNMKTRLKINKWKNIWKT